MQSRGVRASGWEVTVSIYASIWWLTERDASWFSEREERHQTAADNATGVTTACRVTRGSLERETRAGREGWTA